MYIQHCNTPYQHTLSTPSQPTHPPPPPTPLNPLFSQRPLCSHLFHGAQNVRVVQPPLRRTSRTAEVGQTDRQIGRQTIGNIITLFNTHQPLSNTHQHPIIPSNTHQHPIIPSNTHHHPLPSFPRFLKSQVRDWLRNVASLATYRSNQPSWQSKRGLFQFVTQEYEGRESDVTITPWTKHISVVAAFKSIIKVSGWVGLVGRVSG